MAAPRLTKRQLHQKHSFLLRAVNITRIGLGAAQPGLASIHLCVLLNPEAESPKPLEGSAWPQGSRSTWFTDQSTSSRLGSHFFFDGPCEPGQASSPAHNPVSVPFFSFFSFLLTPGLFLAGKPSCSCTQLSREQTLWLRAALHSPWLTPLVWLCYRPIAFMG